MIARRRLTPALGFVGLLAVLGCSKEGSTTFSTVSGIATFNGSPMEGARIEFPSTTESEGKHQSYASVTDSSGKYMIAPAGKNPGIPPGMYKVVITKTNMKGGDPNAGKEGFDAGQIEAAASAGGSPGIINYLPREYGSLATTKLSATIDVGKNPDVNFDLKGKAGQ